jgi:16S rRNA (cytidine1402-2'-O)-methyltransferase
MPLRGMLRLVLSIVSTPIGNLGDISDRAMQTLMHCDAIVCEDTRVTGKLLNLLDLPKKELTSFHSYSDAMKVERLITRLKREDHLALVSDAGTPGISDPGFAIVSRVHEEGIAIEVIPGPSAFLAALSISGLPINRFVYLGFLPLKKGRQTLLRSLQNEDRTVVFYESTHRIRRTLVELANVLGHQPDRPVVLCRELTKLHEEVVRTRVGELSEVSKRVVVKGEFCVVLGPQ